MLARPARIAPRSVPTHDSSRARPGRSAGSALWATVANRSGPVLPKLVAGDRDDACEADAERVADEVMAARPRAAPPTTAARATSAATADPAISPVSTAVESALRSAGHPLEPADRRRFESHLGQDLGSVRLHHDDPAARSAESVGARAYTFGDRVVFGPNEYPPGSSDWRRLLAHELTHVAQQGASSARHVMQRQPQNPPAPVAADSRANPEPAEIDR